MSFKVVARGFGWRHAGRRAFALRGLDLLIEEGEKVLLLGASGSGKSTLLAGLAGLLDEEAGEEEGELLVGGRPARQGIGRAGIVFQDPTNALVMGRIGDEVAFGLENLGVDPGEIWKRVGAALSAVGLAYPLEHPSAALSGGEQQRLAIAGVLATRPHLVLFDEPTSNLDPDGAALVRATLFELLKDPDTTLVLVEHRVDELLDLVERVVVLEAGGGVLLDGSPSEIFTRHRDRLSAAGVFLPGRSIARRSPKRHPGELVVTAEEVTYSYPSSRRPALFRANLSVRAGEVLALTGANGSGKTTLSLVLSSLVRPSSGVVAFHGGGPNRPYARWRARDLVRFVGTVFQEPEHQFVARTVAAELALGPRRAGFPEAETDKIVSDLLEVTGLHGLGPANPFTLSGGEKRRLSVAAALSTEPLLLVLDEPTFGQDARTFDGLVALLDDAANAGRAVVTVTHDEELIDAIADERYGLRSGFPEALPGPGA